jgi:hypothetical protein
VLRLKLEKSCDLSAGTEVIHEAFAVQFDVISPVQLFKTTRRLFLQPTQRRFTRLHLPQSITHHFGSVIIKSCGHLFDHKGVQSRWQGDRHAR